MITCIKLVVSYSVAPLRLLSGKYIKYSLANNRSVDRLSAFLLVSCSQTFRSGCGEAGLPAAHCLLVAAFPLWLHRVLYLRHF
jgi:hypothetical protein